MGFIPIRTADALLIHSRRSDETKVFHDLILKQKQNSQCLLCSQILLKSHRRGPALERIETCWFWTSKNPIKAYGSLFVTGPKATYQVWVGSSKEFLMKRQIVVRHRNEFCRQALVKLFACFFICSTCWGVQSYASHNLAWDDADYLRDGLKVANSLRLDWSTRPWHSATSLLRVKPKPPMLVGWIAAGGLVPTLRNPTNLFLFATSIPFAGLLIAIGSLAVIMSGYRGGLIALVGLIGAPMALSFGFKVMVETFMGLWVTLVLFYAVRLVERSDRKSAVGLGIFLGLASLTKLTAVLILPAPLLVALGLSYRRYGFRQSAAMVGWVVVVGLMIAGPWYLRNGGTAVRFALFSSQYNQLMLGSSERLGSADRLLAIGRDLIGWPLVAVATLAGVLSCRDFWRSNGDLKPDDLFVILAIVCFGSATIVLLLPAYFDPRFLLPAWPVVSVALGVILARVHWSRNQLKSVVCASLLTLAVVQSIQHIASEPKTTTFWATRDLIDHLVSKYGAANLFNVGNCRDWNVSKTGLINEFRSDPRDCFVLHDLSSCSPEDFARKLRGAEAVVALDRPNLPASWFDYGPNLNRSCVDNVERMLSGLGFHRIMDFPDADLPPLIVFVRHDPKTAGLVGKVRR